MSNEYSTDPSNVYTRHEAAPGRVYLVQGTIVKAKELVSELGVVCRKISILKTGFVVAEKAFCLDATHHASRFGARCYARPIGDVVFESKGIQTFGAAEDRWMKLSYADAKSELERSARLESFAIEEIASLAVLQALRVRSDAVATAANSTASS